MTKTFLILQLLFLTLLSSGCEDYDRIALLLDSIYRLQFDLEETQMELEQKIRGTQGSTKGTCANKKRTRNVKEGRGGGHSKPLYTQLEI